MFGEYLEQLIKYQSRWILSSCIVRDIDDIEAIMWKMPTIEVYESLSKLSLSIPCMFSYLKHGSILISPSAGSMTSILQQAFGLQYYAGIISPPLVSAPIKVALADSMSPRFESLAVAEQSLLSGLAS